MEEEEDAPVEVIWKEDEDEDVSIVRSVDNAQHSNNSNIIILDSNIDENDVILIPQKLPDENQVTSMYNRNKLPDDDIKETSVNGICSICFDYWSTKGDHQLVATKCGHLFGLSCIKKWLIQPTSKSCCPICKTKLNIKQGFTKINGVTEINVFDNEERNTLKEELKSTKAKCQKLENEKRLLEISIQRLKMRCNQQEKELQRISKISHVNNKQQYNNGIYSVNTNSNNNCILNNSSFIEISSESDNFKKFGQFSLTQVIDTNQSRVCEVLASQYLILVDTAKASQSVNNNNNSNKFTHGVLKISILEPNNREIIWNHGNSIRDMKISPFNPQQLLTASFDQTMKITDLRSKSSIVSFACDTKVWSCEWNHKNDNFVYSGLNNTTVQIFDIRSPKDAVFTLPPPENAVGPCYTLHSFPSLQNFKIEGKEILETLVAGTAGCASLYSWLEPQSSRSQILFSNDEGKRSIVSLDLQSEMFIISYLKSKVHQGPSYKVGRLSLRNDYFEEDEICYFPSFNTTNTMMSRPNIFSLPPKEQMFAATSVGSKISLWEVAAGEEVCNLSCFDNTEVIDIKTLSISEKTSIGNKRSYSSFSGKNFLFGLTCNQLFMFER